MRATAVCSSRSSPMYPTLTRGNSSSTGPRSPRPARSTGIATTSCSTEIASASFSGVCTVPCTTGRSAVASYTSSVMILRASTLNSSGWVARSRKPRRLSATSGWLLTFSGTCVLFDQKTDRVHRDLQHAIHIRRIEMMDLSRAELVHAQVDRACTQLPDARHNEKRGRLHVVAQHARSRPHLQLVSQVRPRHGVWHQIRVERIHRADDPDVMPRTRRFRGRHDCIHHVD